MIHDLTALKKALTALPALSSAHKLARIVPLEALELKTPHEWLYITGKAYRYNLPGTKCLYFSETLDVAKMEYDSYWVGLPGADQPLVIISADVNLDRVLDLTDAAVLKALGIPGSDLFINWRTAKSPTITQLIGTAVQETGHFSAIRYPSAAVEPLGRKGINFAIYQDHIHAPNWVRVLGPNDRILEEWP